MAVTVRPESPKDIQAIREITQAAFRAESHLPPKESNIIDRLRESDNLAFSLVAERGNQIIGHIAISPVEIHGQNRQSEGWYGLGPLAVHPDSQRRGVGSKLIQQALQDLQGKDAAGCVVLGKPEYYTRFGFSQDHNLRFEGAPSKFFMARSMKGDAPVGMVKYHDAFYVES